MILALEIMGVTQVQAGMTGLLQRLSDMRPMANPWDWRLRASTEKHFAQEGTHKGKWDELKQSTQIQRERLARQYGWNITGAHPILVRSQRLKSSLIRRTDSDHILEAHPKYIDFGSKVEYAIYHQTGTSKMAQRLMVGIDAKTFSRMIQDLRTFLTEGRVGVIG